MATTVSALQRPRVAHGQRQHREELVAVDDLAGVVHGQAAVGVPVQGEADVRPVLEDGGLQHVQVGRAAPVVDVEAVRLGADRDHLGAGVAQRERTGDRGGAVRAVQDDLDALERARATVETRWAA